VDGRLDEMGLPHIPKKERLRFTEEFLSKNKSKLTKKEIRNVLNKLWGKKIRKKQEVLASAKKLHTCCRPMPCWWPTRVIQRYGPAP